MALQNLKQMEFIGSNYGGTGAAVAKTVHAPQTPTATASVAAPIITTNSATVPAVNPDWFIPQSVTISGATQFLETFSSDYFFVNQNPGFWVTLQIQMASQGFTPVTVQYPIPPNGVMFLPRGTVSLTVLGGNPYNSLLSAPIGGVFPVTLDQVIQQ
jgi:hypothetical protein